MSLPFTCELGCRISFRVPLVVLAQCPPGIQEHWSSTTSGTQATQTKAPSLVPTLCVGIPCSTLCVGASTNNQRPRKYARFSRELAKNARLLSRAKTTRSVEDGIPTEDRGNELVWFQSNMTAAEAGRS